MSAARLARMRGVLDRRQPDLTVVMAGVHKEHNVSAVLRTCDAVGVAEAHAMGAEERLAVKQTAAAGVGRRVPIRQQASVRDGCAALRGRGFQLLGAHLAPSARDFRDMDYCRPTAILLGNEKEGLEPDAQAACDAFIEIPMVGLAASLNVSVAAAVILYEAQRQRQRAGLYDTRRLGDETYRRTLFEWLQPRLASYCQTRGLPYPELDEEGHVVRLAGRPHAPDRR